MGGRNFHQERDGSKGGFRKPFLPIVPLKASLPVSPPFLLTKGEEGEKDFQTSDVCCSPFPTPKEQSPFPSLGRMRNPPINQVATDRPDPKWIGIRHSAETFFCGGVQTGSNRGFPPLDPSSPLQFCRTSKREGRGGGSLLKGRGRRRHCSPLLLLPSFFPPFLSETGKKHFISVMKRKKEQKKRRKLSALKLCIVGGEEGGNFSSRIFFIPWPVELSKRRLKGGLGWRRSDSKEGRRRRRKSGGGKKRSKSQFSLSYCSLFSFPLLLSADPDSRPPPPLLFAQYVTPPSSSSSSD